MARLGLGSWPRRWDLTVPPIPAEGRMRPLSGATWRYNCVGWALGDPRFRWWPHDRNDPTWAGWFWPEDVPSSETIESFTLLLAKYGFSPTDDGRLTEGIEKVALFRNRDAEPSHIAWQTVQGLWASKVGTNGSDSLHDRPDDANCLAYGEVFGFFERPRQRWQMPSDPMHEGVIVDWLAPPGTVVVR
jgi:hypothetical protein